MKLFSIDIQIAATAYILADDQEEAMEIAADLKDDTFEFSNRRQEIADGVVVTGESYSGDMPSVSLSPAMTCLGPYHGQVPEFVEEFTDDEAEEL